MKIRKTSLIRFFISLVLILPALCLVWVTFAQPQGDPVRCKKLMAVGERLQAELEQLQENLGNDECQGLGRIVCQRRINAKQLQIEANRQQIEIACAERQNPTPTATPTPAATPEPIPEESTACRNAKKLQVSLQEQQEKAQQRLNEEECSGPARTICVARVNRLAEQLRNNAKQIRVECFGETPVPAVLCPVVVPPGQAEDQVILETVSLLSTGGFKNPEFDTSSLVWAEQICGGAFHTWLSGKDPRYEWTPILNRTVELEDADVAISGTAINAHPSDEDVWFLHPFGNDLNFDVAPDSEYVRLTSPILKPDPGIHGTDNSICKARSQFGLNVSNVLHVEMDSGFVPDGYQAKEGDRVAVLGRWVVDCGHDSYGAEIHPPLLYLTARRNGPDSTVASIISRPFLVSQEFGDGGLYEHLVNELLKIYPPLLPFPLTKQVEARPQIIHRPFSGTKLFVVKIQPPTPRHDPRDQLVVSYQLLVRNGVTVKFFNFGDDAVGLGLVLDEAGYNLAPLPKRENRNISKAEITRVRDDIGQLIFHFQGAGSSLAQPFGAIVLQKGVDTDFYQMPTVTDPPPINTSVSQVNSIRIQPDDGQPWPIRGHITVQWKRSVPLDPIPLPRRPAEVTVPANVLWIDTGVSLQAGQHFRVQASGLWSNTGRPAKDPNGFEGFFHPGSLLPSANFASLIGRVGGVMFPVGESFAGTSPAGGTLFLSINDLPDTFADNQGTLAVSIVLQ